MAEELGFSKSFRLILSSEFSAVFDNSCIKVHHQQFLVLATLNSYGHPRLGLVIAKKHVRKATNRNRIKRLLRESFRKKQHHLPAIDAIVLARRGSESLKNENVLEIIDSLWNRAAQKTKKLEATTKPAS